MTQHAAGKVISSDVGQIPLAIDQSLDQRRAMNGFLVAAGKQGLPVRLGAQPAGLVVVQLHGMIGEFACRTGHCTGPCLFAMHRLGTYWRCHIRCATEHRIDNLAFDSRAKTQRRHTDPRRRHDLQGVFCPVHDMKTLGRVMQGSRLGWRVGTIDMQLSAGYLLANQRPDRGFQPEHRIPVGRMAKVTDMKKVCPVFKRYRRLGRNIDHQWAPVQQVARKPELLDQQFDFHFGNHQRQITTIK
ncbi:hypothetical protein D3C86_1363770 [compost metagenome]